MPKFRIHLITNNKVRIFRKIRPNVQQFNLESISFLNLFSKITNLQLSNNHSEIQTNSHNPLNPLNPLNHYTTTPKCFQTNFKDNQFRINPIPQYKNGSKLRVTYRQNLNSSLVNEIIVIIYKNKILKKYYLNFFLSLQYFI
jgi:hypothetical protein